MPEVESPETQEEFGWENLSAVDDGRRDMGEPVQTAEPEPEQEAQTAETVEQPAVEAEAAVDQQAAQEPEPQEVVFTLPGGKKVTRAELIADDKLLSNLVTHSNQLTNFQRLAEERKAKLEQVEAENRRVLDEYTRWQMQQQAQQAQQAQQQQPQPQRPPAQVIEGAYAPVLDQMVQDGRLTQDHRTEFGPLIAEYLFDHQNLRNMVASVIQAGQQEFQSLRQTLDGDVVPNVQQFRVQQATALDQQVQQEIATIPGYEGLADQNEWNRLKAFISEKVNASPRLENGRPSFDPSFDPITMAQMYDAMTGAQLRQQIATEKARQEQAANQTRSMVGGEAAAKAGGPVPRKPGKLSPEEEAMDFGSPNMMTG